MAGCSTCRRGVRSAWVTSEGSIVETFQHSSEAMQVAGLWNRITRLREESEPQLGERSSIDPARLDKQERTVRSVRAAGEDRGGEVKDVRHAIFSGDDVAAVQIAVRDTPLVNRIEQTLQPFEELPIKITGQETAEIATGEILHQQRLSIDACDEARDTRHAAQTVVGASLAIELPWTEERADRPGTLRKILKDERPSVDLNPIDDRLGRVPARMEADPGEFTQSAAWDIIHGGAGRTPGRSGSVW